MKKSKLSRRNFLKSTTVASAVGLFPAIIPSSAMGADGHVAPSNRITMGQIGIGMMGGGNLGAFLGKKEVQVVAVCDVEKAHCDNGKRMVDERYGNQDCAAYWDFREFYTESNLDALSIALPDHWHAVISIEAAKAGMDIYGEKPLARSIKEGRAICDAVKRYGRVWQTGSWQRSTGNFHRAAELVRNGRIGKIKYVEVGLPSGHTDFGGTQGQETPGSAPESLKYNRWLGPAPKAPYCPARIHTNWRWVLDYSGGQLTDWAGHHIDIAHWGLDLDDTGPHTIKGKGVYPKDGLWNTPTEYRVECTYKDDLKIVVANDTQLPHGMGTVWYGERGWLHVSRGGLNAENPDVLREKIGPNDIHLYKSRDHQQNFLDCVKNRQKTITPVESAHRSISVALLGEIAMLTGRELKWDPVKEEFKNDSVANALLCRSYREPWLLA